MVAALPDKTAQCQIITAIEKSQENKNQELQTQPLQQPQQTYWNNNLPPL